MDRQAWLEERRKGIGASDAAAVCGVSPWGSPLSVYLDKIGALPPADSPPLRWGLALEEVIAGAYVETTGRYLLKPEEAIWHHDSLPWMFATLDRYTSCGRVVELKTSRDGKGWGEPGTAEIPEPYLVQVTHQMAVAGVEVADVAVLIAGSDFRVYTVPFNEVLARRIIDLEGDFWWRHVEKRQPPEPDWTDPRTPELVELLHRPVEGKVVQLGEEAWAYALRYHQAGEEIREFSKIREKARARLLALCGEASLGLLPGGLEIVRRTVTRKEYVSPATSYQTLTIRKGRKHDSQRDGNEQGGGAQGPAGEEPGATRHGAPPAPDAGPHDSGGADGLSALPRPAGL